MPFEIDLRREFIKTLHGAVGEEAKGMRVLLRRLRRDPVTFSRTACACKDSFTREPDLDHICPSCLGEGYLWDEEWAICYKVQASSSQRAHLQPGIMYQDVYRFYFEYDMNLLEGDTIIELVMDEEGNIKRPYRRYLKWTPSGIQVKRLDQGRIEFYIVTCQKTNAIYIDKENFSYTNNP